MPEKQRKVSELVEELKDKLEASNIMNLKYLDQNFHMKKEMKLLENRENVKGSQLTKHKSGGTP